MGINKMSSLKNKSKTIKDMRLAGSTIAEIAKECNVSGASICKHIAKYHPELQSTKKRTKWEGENLNKLIEMVEKGDSDKKIAKHFNTKSKTIESVRRYYMIESKWRHIK